MADYGRDIFFNAYLPAGDPVNQQPFHAQSGEAAGPAADGYDYDPTTAPPVMGGMPGYCPPPPPMSPHGPMNPYGPPPGPMSPPPAHAGPPPPPGPPGYGPPGRPPVMPAKKGNTGVILAVVLGMVVLLGLGGAGVWFFVINVDRGAPYQYPDSHTTIMDQAPVGATYYYDKGQTFNLCNSLDLAAVERVLPLDGLPEHEVVDDGDGSAYVNCSGPLRSTVVYQGTSRTGVFTTGFQIQNDIAAAGDDFASVAELYSDYRPYDLGEFVLGEESIALTHSGDELVQVVMASRNGNLTAVSIFDVTAGNGTQPPDVELLINVLLDVMNEGMTLLA